MIKGYVDGTLFMKSEHAGTVRYNLEQEILLNGAKSVSYHIPGLLFGDYNFINGVWVCKDRP